MKKLMIGLVGACAFGVMAEVASENVVGYTGAVSGDNFNFTAVPFSSVGYNTADVQMIKISDDDTGTIGEGAEFFEIWTGAPEVVEGTSFVYCPQEWDPSGTVTDSFYWGDDDGNPVSLSIAPGQGVVLTLSEGLKVSYAGEVAAEKIEVKSGSDFNFLGNTFASAIDVQDISIDDDGAGTIGEGAEFFEIWTGAPEVVEGTSFVYCPQEWDPTGTVTEPFYWGDDDGNPVTLSIKPGQGFVLNLSEGLTISIKAPY